MKIAYVIAPYRSDTIVGIKNNIDKAGIYAMNLWLKGYAVICPHKNSAFFDGLLPDDKFLKGGIEILSRCDIAFAGDFWMQSLGSKDEVAYCMCNKIPIYFNLKDVPDESYND